MYIWVHSVFYISQKSELEGEKIRAATEISCNSIAIKENGQALAKK